MTCARAVMLVVAFLLCTPPAYAQSSRADANVEKQPGKRELGAVPLAGGDTDVGIGVGFLASYALTAPGERQPYAWRFESGGFVTFRRSGDGVDFPYVTAYLAYAKPRLLNGKLRFDARFEHVTERNLRYYGLGNASVRPSDDNRERDLYERSHPILWLRGRYNLPWSVFAGAGTSYTQNWVTVKPGSTLQMDQESSDPFVKDMLSGPKNHGLWLLEASTGLDTRDNDIDPQHGQFHQLTGRVSPAVGDAVPYAYQQLNVTLRFYTPLIAERSVLALWGTFDAQFGHPPFYELPRFEETFAIGGNQGVRGVPGQRYSGKVKAMGSAEVRTRVLDFKVVNKPWSVGIATFADAGRLWTDFSRRSDLDGDGLGLKYGLGIGLRVLQGKTFVVRADVAWSPDARPLGAYVIAGHAH